MKQCLLIKPKSKTSTGLIKVAFLAALLGLCLFIAIKG